MGFLILCEFRHQQHIEMHRAYTETGLSAPNQKNHETSKHFVSKKQLQMTDMDILRIETFIRLKISILAL